MKVVILAGGLGTRLSEETSSIPKPMVKIGELPILLHIMRHYYFYGYKEFIILLGYKGDVIKEYFLNYPFNSCDFSLQQKTNKKFLKDFTPEDWTISFVDTGQNTMTGGRIKRIKKYLNKNEDFMMTYGDGLANINIIDLIKFHKKNQKLITLTGVTPQARFGSIECDKNMLVEKFIEKP